LDTPPISSFEERVKKTARVISKGSKEQLATSGMPSFRTLLLAAMAVAAAALAPTQLKSGPKTCFSEGGRIVKSAGLAAAGLAAGLFFSTPNPAGAAEVVLLTDNAVTSSKSAPAMPAPLASLTSGSKDSSKKTASFWGLVNSAQLETQFEVQTSKFETKFADLEKRLDIKFIGLGIVTALVPSGVMLVVETQKTAREVEKTTRAVAESEAKTARAVAESEAKTACAVAESEAFAANAQIIMALLMPKKLV
jgi:hypothetical protein